MERIHTYNQKENASGSGKGCASSATEQFCRAIVKTIMKWVSYLLMYADGLKCGCIKEHNCKYISRICSMRWYAHLDKYLLQNIKIDF